MNVPKEQLKEKPRRIGYLKGNEVYTLLTKGGFNILCVKNKNGTSVISVGNHVGVAKAVAKQHHPDIVFDELSKAEELPPETYNHLLPFWSEFTEKLDVALNA